MWIQGSLFWLSIVTACLLKHMSVRHKSNESGEV
jgi:hypothetical protein